MRGSGLRMVPLTFFYPVIAVPDRHAGFQLTKPGYFRIIDTEVLDRHRFRNDIPRRCEAAASSNLNRIMTGHE